MINNPWIKTCPQCFEKLMPSLIFERGFMCDNCGAYAEDLDDETMKEIQDYVKEREEGVFVGSGI